MTATAAALPPEAVLAAPTPAAEPGPSAQPPEPPVDECPMCLDELAEQPVYTLGCNHTFHCNCMLKYLAKLSVQHEHTYIDGATYKLDPGCPICRAPFSVKGVQRELRGIEFDRSA